MVTWQKFNKYFLPNKNGIYSNLNIENISKYDYEHSKEVWNGILLKLQFLVIYVQCYTFLLTDIFKKFRGTF